MMLAFSASVALPYLATFFLTPSITIYNQWRLLILLVIIDKQNKNELDNLLDIGQSNSNKLI